MDPGKIFQIITNSTLLATRLLSGAGGSGLLEFTQARYCVVVHEDVPIASTVVHVAALHRHAGVVRFSITGGNRDGIFTIDHRSGLITLAAALNFEHQDKHELVVAAEASGVWARTLVLVKVVDANDQAPYFLDPAPKVTVIEEDDRDLPAPIIKVEAVDEDLVDRGGLVYSIGGDGVDDLAADDAFFSIEPRTGQVIQLRPLDRDPPHGKSVWKIKVQVRDGHATLGQGEELERNREFSGQHHQQPPGHQAESQSLQNLSPLSHVAEHDRPDQETMSHHETWSHHHDQPRPLYHQAPGRVHQPRPLHYRAPGGVHQPRLLRYQAPGRVHQPRPLYHQAPGRVHQPRLLHYQAPGRVHQHPASQQDKREPHYDDQAPLNVEGSGDGSPTTLETMTDTVVLGGKGSVVRISSAEDKPAFDMVSLQERREGQYVTKEDHTLPSASEEKEDEDDPLPANVKRRQYVNSEAERVAASRATKPDTDGRGKHAAHESNGRLIHFARPISPDSSTKVDDPPSRLHHGSVSGPARGALKTSGPPLSNTDGGSDREASTTVALPPPPPHPGRRPAPDASTPGVVNTSHDTPRGRSEYPNIDSRIRLIRTGSAGEDEEGREEKLESRGTYGGKDGHHRTSSFKSGERVALSGINDPGRRQVPLQRSRGRASDRLQRSGVAQSMDDFSSSNSQENLFAEDAGKLGTYLEGGEAGTQDEHHKYYFPGDQTTSQADRLQAPPELEGNTTHLEGSGQNKSHSFERMKYSGQRRPSSPSYSDRQRQANAEFITVPPRSRGKVSEILKNSGDPFMRSVMSSSAAAGGGGEQEAITSTPTSGPGPSHDAFHNVSHSSDETSSHPDPQGRDASGTASFRDVWSPDTTTQGHDASNTATIRDVVRSVNTTLQGRDASSPETIRDVRSLDTTLQGRDDGNSITPRDTDAPDTTPEDGNTSVSTINKGSDACQDFFMSREEPLDPRGGGAAPSHRGAGGGDHTRRVHVVETVVMVVVKDINDNAPIFPTSTMYGQVKENGPKDLPVAIVSAWDPDDPGSRNARVTYSIEKNVIHEGSGEAIFGVDPESGVVRTNRCCLDRETTPEYYIQVVATDGGGLKGTGTVVVRLSDENDNSPRLVRRLWETATDETTSTTESRQPGEGGDSLLELTLADPDTHNHFLYRVVEGSGWGWQLFGVRTEGSVGHLYARHGLDFENEEHRRGFRFLVEVTDKGAGGWSDPRHTDSAWVKVTLNDLNDNPPLFPRPHAHVTIAEDTHPGTLLATFPARDPDMGGHQGVDYRMEGAVGALGVDKDGSVRLLRGLDRDDPEGQGSEVTALILATDRGYPSLTSTATLSLTITDVNDCAPRLLPPTTLHVVEGSPPSLLAALRATDEDLWSLGHGPPFTFSLAPTNPPHVLASIDLRFDPHADSGRGGAQLWTSAPLDREKHRQLLVEVLLADAEAVNDTTTVTVVVDDLNDNPMRPAAKTVYLWKTQGVGREAPLGRVWVDDPDDWDLHDKTFRWAGHPHPLFSLDDHTGAVTASHHLRQGRYELQFAVSDRVWQQTGVEANMTVLVRYLSPEALGNAAHIALTPSTPEDLAKGWTPTGGGGVLGTLTQQVLEIVEGGADCTVEVVSVYGEPLQHPSAISNTSSNTVDVSTSTNIWLSVREGSGRFMDPIKLQGLLALHTGQLEAATGLKVAIRQEEEGPETLLREQEAPSRAPNEGPTRRPDPDHPSDLEAKGRDLDPSSATSLASTSLSLQVVDTNSTALVTPRLTHARDCHAHAHDPYTCTPNTCLNGGRCVRSHNGNRCVCPGGSWGPRCKVLGRSFQGEGWVWLPALPPCLPTTISFDVLTSRSQAILLYSGPLASSAGHQGPPRTSATPLLAVQLSGGRPQVLLEGPRGSVKLEVNTTVNDGDWHALHLRLDPQGVGVMVDLCGRGRDQDDLDDAHCVARAAWTRPRAPGAWVGGWPLQVGGLAHRPPRPETQGWSATPTARPLKGCLSHLRVNGQLLDLGEAPYHRGTTPGCPPQDAACPGGCGHRGACLGGLHHPRCQCQAGWAGPRCDTPTPSVTLGSSSFMKMALSFTPPPRAVRAQVRVRATGPRHGLLLRLAQRQNNAALSLHLRAGVACVSVSGVGWVTREACVEGKPLGDGAWHTVTAERHGDNLVISVDDGDDWRRNESLAMLEGRGGRGGARPPTTLQVDKHDGVSVGGVPEFLALSLVTVHHDLHQVCLDDLRLCGRSLPLPPSANGTTWGQVTTLAGLEPGCSVLNPCANTTCTPPLTCATNTWGHPTCRSGHLERGHSPAVCARTGVGG
ncbi:putative neural-cadherin 2 isoform X3 [Panulirus ornatus]|uniref:putative neural-cadherin 2 isoform X3 n=1 Tax=Panulirus ornatus TaxID=150431 RepID=UPI003A8C2A87